MVHDAPRHPRRILFFLKIVCESKVPDCGRFFKRPCIHLLSVTQKLTRFPHVSLLNNSSVTVRLVLIHLTTATTNIPRDSTAPKACICPQVLPIGLHAVIELLPLGISLLLCTRTVPRHEHESDAHIGPEWHPVARSHRHGHEFARNYATSAQLLQPH